MSTDSDAGGERRTRIHLVRHGTTLLNRANRYRGRRDVPLDQGGWHDAWCAAGELEGGTYSAVYSSPLRRARDTARIIADVVGIATVEDMPGFVNLEYGAWEGLTSSEASARDPELFARYQEYAPGAFCPSGELLDDAAHRMQLSLRLIASLHPGQSVAAVSHAATVRLAISQVTGGPRENWRYALPNGSITVFDVIDDRIVLHRVPPQTPETAAALRD